MCLPGNEQRGHISDRRPKFGEFLIFLADETVDFIPDYLLGFSIRPLFVYRGIVDSLATSNGDVPRDHAHTPQNIAPDKVWFLGIVHIFRQGIGTQIHERIGDAFAQMQTMLLGVEFPRLLFRLTFGSLVLFVTHG